MHSAPHHNPQLLPARSWLLRGAAFVAIVITLHVARPVLLPLESRVFRGLIASLAFGAAAEITLTDRTSAIARGYQLPPKADTVAIFSNRETGAAIPYALESYHHLFAPVTILIGLLVVTPAPLSRRAAIGVISLLLLLLLIWLRLWLFAGNILSSPEVAALAWPGWLRGVAATIVSALLDPPSSRVVLPLLVWLCVAFRVRDWIRATAPHDPETGEID